MTAKASWHRALAFALVGRELPLGDQSTPAVASLAADLASLSWDADAVRRHALEVTAAGEPWPHLVPAGMRAGLGAAQFQAALLALRELLDVAALDVQPPSTRTDLTAAERVLLAEVPPHHGH